MNTDMHLIDASLEAVFLGTILRTGNLDGIRGMIAVSDFGLEKHRLTYQAILDVADEVLPTADAVGQRLMATGRIEAAGGFSALMELHQQAIPGPFGRLCSQSPGKIPKPTRGSA